MNPNAITLIYARSLNQVIGNDLDLPPWKILGDLPRFKEMTTDAVVVMGRKTWDSLPFKLPNRTSVVISRHPHDIVPKKNGDKPDFVYMTPEMALTRTYTDDFDVVKKIFIIGGAQIYEAAQHYAHTIEETVVMSNMVPGNVFWQHSVATNLVKESRTTAKYRTTIDIDGHKAPVDYVVDAIFRTHHVRNLRV